MAVPVAAISAGVGAVTGIVDSITSISDASKRRLYEQNLGLLNFDQKAKLEKLLRSANSEDARQQILAQTLGSANVARIDALAKVQVEKEKTKKTLLVIGIIGGILLIGGVILVMRKK
jgi:hypothetical protein